MNKSILIKLISLALSLTFILCGFAGCKSKSDTSSNNDSMVDASNNEDSDDSFYAQRLSGIVPDTDPRLLTPNETDGPTMQLADTYAVLFQSVGLFMDDLKNSKFEYTTDYNEARLTPAGNNSFTISFTDIDVSDYTYEVKVFNPTSNTIALGDCLLMSIQIFNMGDSEVEKYAYASQFMLDDGSDTRSNFIKCAGGFTNGAKLSDIQNYFKNNYEKVGFSLMTEDHSRKYSFNALNYSIFVHYNYWPSKYPSMGMIISMVVDADTQLCYDISVEFKLQRDF